MLLDILQDIAAKEGVYLDDPTQRSRTVMLVNQAAREIHEHIDIPESTSEGIFNINVESNQVAFPYFVEHIRAVRYYDGRERIDLDHGKNRWDYDYGNETWMLKWRQKKSSPFCREISNQSVLRLSIPLAEAAKFNVTVVGPTDNSARATEVLAFPVNTTEVQSVMNFKEPIESVSKDIITTYDLTIKDVEGNILAVIPNNQKESNYKIIQILDTDAQIGPSSYSSVEALYKETFKPALNDSDTFWGTSKYDKAIYWKYMEITASSPSSMGSYAAKFSDLIQKIQISNEAGLRKKINFRKPAFFNLPYARVWPTR